MTNPETAVTVIEPQRAIQVSLDAWPESEYNRLIPVQTLGLGTDLIKPIVQAVQLRPAGSDGISPDHYSSPDIPNGRRALTKRALDALASVAGVDFTDETRLDDGTDPMVCGVQVRAEMLLPTGRRITTTGTKWVDMRRMAWKNGLESAQAGKFKAMIYEHTASRARNRAIRSLLSLQQSYSIAELAKPFAVVSFVPNMDHPEIRSRILDAMAPAIAATYGPTGGRAQIGPGTVAVPEAPDDDEPSAPLLPARATPPAQAHADSGSPAAAAPVPSGAPEEPEWMRGGPAATAAAAGPALVDMIRASAADPDAQRGKPTKAQWDELERIFNEAGEDKGTVIKAGLAALWPQDGEALSGARARAIILAADSLDGDFLPAWRELAGGAS